MQKTLPEQRQHLSSIPGELEILSEVAVAHGGVSGDTDSLATTPTTSHFTEGRHESSVWNESIPQTPSSEKASQLSLGDSHTADYKDGHILSHSVASEQNSNQGDAEKQQPSSQALSTEPPDGGLHAWLTVLGASLVAMNAFGTVNSFGTFLDYYTTTYMTDSPATVLSMIGSVQVFVLYFCSFFVGPLFDAWGPKYMIPVSGISATFALVMLSLAQKNQVYQVFLTQSVLFSFGAGLGFTPSLALISHWFKRRNALALGCVLGSASFGGLVYSLLVEALFPLIGFGWTVRALALLVGVFYLIACLTIHARRPTKPLPRLSQLIDFPAFLDIRYTLFVLGAFVTLLGIFQPYFQIGGYAAVVLGKGNKINKYLLPIMNATSIVGRIAPGHLADRWGRYNIIVGATLLSGIFTIGMWYTSSSEASTIAFAAIFGFVSGPFFTLMPACVAQISPIEKVGSRVGMLFATLSFAALAGSPIGGIFLKEKTSEAYRHLTLYSAVLLLAGAALLLVARFSVASKLPMAPGSSAKSRWLAKV